MLTSKASFTTACNNLNQMNHLSCLGQQKKPRLSQRQWLRITCYYFPPWVWTTLCSYLSAVNHNQGKLRPPGSPSDPRRLRQHVPSVLNGAHFPTWRPTGGPAPRGRGWLAGGDARPGELPCRRRASPRPSAGRCRGASAPAPLKIKPVSACPPSGIEVGSMVFF